MSGGLLQTCRGCFNFNWLTVKLTDLSERGPGEQAINSPPGPSRPLRSALKKNLKL